MKVGRGIGVAALAVVVLVLGGFLALRFGVYNVAATDSHASLTYWALNQVKVWSIADRAQAISAPDLSDAGLIETGRQSYQRFCVQCHGAPGIARHDIGKGMIPVPNNLVQTARDRSAATIFWAVKNGIKSTGMPAWDYRLDDEGIWAITAFVKHMPEIVPADYREKYGGRSPKTGQGRQSPPQGAAAGKPEGDAARGLKAIQQFGCRACHIVPGLTGPETRVGPSLAGMAKRKFIAGVLANTSQDMVRWLSDPVAVDPLTAMPDMGVSPARARDMAAFLATLE